MQNDKSKFKEDFKKRLYRFVLPLKSANESKVWISTLKDSNKCDGKEAQWLLVELSEIARIFASSILTLKGKK